ncbi:MAG: M20/M25/M40 family metallo-hydrolase, partial [Lachnospiraceae bacterium]|nr:M20/M25/M40 family metallo-hydrolase [Lachnospiraceae bacterium]
MSVLGGLMPRRVFEIFEDLTRIPRGSGNTKEVEEYLVNYAIAHGFKYVHEEIGNVIIFVDGRGAGKGKDSVMLQGHMDMVCEKTIDSRHNFRKDPLPIAVMDDYVYAKQTTLGGDDGIAIAYALALAEDEHISHPPLEIVITVDEEVGMEGARKLDTSVLSSKTLINIDSEEEGSFVTSCAGGLRGKMEVPVRYRAAEGEKYNIIISGLKG